MPKVLVNAHTRTLQDGKKTQVEAHQREKSRREYASGLPDKSRVTALPTFSESRVWHFSVQEHEAKKAGTHYDLRLGDPRTGIAHSWAIPKARLPEPGKLVLAIRQPDHTVDYMSFRGMLPSGYGAGMVRLKKKEPAEVIYSSEDAVKFAVHSGRETDEYVLRRVGDKAWIMQNITPVKEERPGIPVRKPKYREITPGAIDVENDDQVLQAKIDGAHVNVDIQPGRQTRVFSYRPTERKTGIIDHSFRIPGIIGHKGRTGEGQTLLRGEVYAKDSKGRAIPAAQVGAMLNANVWKSRSMQEQKGLLTTAIFDVMKYKGKDTSSLPYDRKFEILRKIQDENPGLLHVPDTAQMSADKRRLVRSVQSGKNRQTKEGFIIWDKKTGTPTKAKFKEDFDVYVRNVFPAVDKDGKSLDRAGGFEYSWSKTGPIAGRVGTGFNHPLLRELKLHPEKFVGRVAKVNATEKLPGKGALRAPSFREWHLEKGKEV